MRPSTRLSRAGTTEYIVLGAGCAAVAMEEGGDADVESMLAGECSSLQDPRTENVGVELLRGLRGTRC